MTKRTNQELRKLAEQKAGKVEDFSIHKYSGEEIRSILHELQVHQIELEMQNEELHRTLDELEESNLRYFELYNLAPVGYCTLSDKGVILEANLTAASLLGISKSALVRKSITSFIHPGDQDIYYQHRNRLFKSGEPQSCELRLLEKSHDVFWARLEATATRDREGMPVCRIALTNITGLKQAEEEVIRKNEQLEEINRQKDKFFSIIAHDLRSPFNSFLGFTRILAEELHEMTEEEIQKIANAMQRSATNLYNLLGNLLDWSRMQRGVMEFNPEIQPLSDVVKASVASLSELAKQKDMEIHIEVPEDVVVKVDPSMIESTLRNLISNALKFSQRGGKIQLSASKGSSNTVELAVTDQGIGMSRESLGNLFNLTKHPTQKGTEGEPSTGLGLLLCKEFVEKHGGTIQAESEEGKGSRFGITLPEG